MSKSFEAGKQAVFSDIVKTAQQGRVGAGEIAKSAQQTLNDSMEKQASARSQRDAKFNEGRRAACHEFAKTASRYYGTVDVRDDQQALVDIVNGDLPAEAPRSFEMGKQAALEHYADLVDQGATRGQLEEAAIQTLNQPMDKRASAQEDLQRLGVEYATHALLEKAAQHRDVAPNSKGNTGAFDVLKEAAEAHEEMPQGAFGVDTREEDEDTAQRMAQRDRESAPDSEEEARTEAEAEHAGRKVEEAVKNPLDTLGRAARPIGRGAKAYGQALKGERGLGAQIGAGAGTAAGIGGLGYAAKKMYDKKKKQQGGQQKQSSLGNETADEINDALATLDEAGLLD